jgi:hypothetical protein
VTPRSGRIVLPTGELGHTSRAHSAQR